MHLTTEWIRKRVLAGDMQLTADMQLGKLVGISYTPTNAITP